MGSCRWFSFTWEEAQPAGKDKVDPDANKPRSKRKSFWKQKNKPGTHSYKQKQRLSKESEFKKFAEYIDNNDYTNDFGFTAVDQDELKPRLMKILYWKEVVGNQLLQVRWSRTPADRRTRLKIDMLSKLVSKSLNELDDQRKSNIYRF